MLSLQQQLTVYKASAGSGKTFTLATEYIKLLIANPQSYRSILAVTFTNKATEEMKMRILSQLYGIWKQLPDSQSYMEKITNELKITDSIAAKRAGTALSYLIHNYSYFRVETIDTFFQSVLRNLARELDLTANLRLELNDDQVEQQAVDELIESLEPNSEILRWIMSYIRDNIEDDKSWNVIGKIKDFGRNIFKDVYKSNSKSLNTALNRKNFFTEYTAKLHKIKNESMEHLQQYVASFFDVLDENGLSIDDFSYGTSGVCSYFQKLKDGILDDDKLLTKRVLDAMEGAETWVKKQERRPDNPIFALVQSTLWPMLQDIERIRPQQVKLYKSAVLTLQHLNQLRLLSCIDTKVREINKDANRFLLNDTQSLLNALIVNNDSPFIFEKIGAQLEHIMIDEFQDTGTVQWCNFKVLLLECMSRQGTGNMLVGDVKQSIYRWRSGDWRLLNNIENEFGDRKNTVSIRHLDTNYRSNRHIIEFNNAFFKAAASIEYAQQNENYPTGAEELKRAYADVEQQIPTNRPAEGLVHIELLPQEDYQSKMMERLKDTVQELIDSGIPPEKMAILVRFNKTIRQIADYFAQEMSEIKLISDEAFRLDTSLAVNIIIDALHILTHPEDQIATGNLIKAYQKHIINNKLEDSELLTHKRTAIHYLPTVYLSERERLLAMPLFDLIEKLYNIFQLNRLNEQSAYVCTFYDQVNDYLANNTGDIDDFVTEWNENIHRKTIQSNEINGIRLITIHKSKGLEFDNVLMPFCDWKLEKYGSTIWCSPNEAPFNELPFVPIDFSSKQMKGTIYEQDYRHEHLQNSVDNLNLLYVAFTRASKNLFVFGKRNAKNSRSYIIEQCLDNLNSNLNSTINTDFSDEMGENLTFDYGHLSVDDTRRNAKQTANVFNSPITVRPLNIENYESCVQFKQSNQSRDFTKQDESNEKASSYIQIGSVLHNLFSTIHTAADIEPALNQLESNGILYNEDITQDRLIDMLRKRLDDKRVADWFSDKWQLFNECTMLSIDPDTNEVREHRPDRVMTDGKKMIVVDFKFGKPRPEYQNQVRGYMNLLRTMGYPNVKGYLWFVYSNVIEEVK